MNFLHRQKAVAALIVTGFIVAGCASESPPPAVPAASAKAPVDRPILKPGEGSLLVTLDHQGHVLDCRMDPSTGDATADDSVLKDCSSRKYPAIPDGATSDSGRYQVRVPISVKIDHSQSAGTK
jgi:hypothetical protein